MFTPPHGKTPRWFEIESRFRRRLAQLGQAVQFRKRRAAPRWFEPGSAFRRRLDKHLEAVGAAARYDEFEWSGHNSVFERDTAAVALAEKLRKQAEHFQDHKRLVIAHSHGGNVAMRALYHLRDENQPILLVTMATPFI